MSSVTLAVAVAVVTFAAGLFGLALQKRLPQTHLSGGSKDMILAVVGLLTLLLALVLGTLVGNTYAFFAMQKSELETMASRAMLVDQALAQYGPEAQSMRELMKTGLTQSYDLFWRGADVDPAQLKAEVALKRWGAVASGLETLDPKTPAQKDALAGAKANFALMEQMRLLIAATFEPGGLVAGDQRDPLVNVPVLWLRGVVGDQSDHHHCAGVGRAFSGERNVSDLRPHAALFRPLPRAGVIAGRDNPGDRQVDGAIAAASLMSAIGDSRLLPKTAFRAFRQFTEPILKAANGGKRS
jgi:hypothetical protein